MRFEANAPRAVSKRQMDFCGKHYSGWVFTRSDETKSPPIFYVKAATTGVAIKMSKNSLLANL